MEQRILENSTCGYAGFGGEEGGNETGREEKRNGLEGEPGGGAVEVGLHCMWI